MLLSLVRSLLGLSILGVCLCSGYWFDCLSPRIDLITPDDNNQTLLLTSVNACAVAKNWTVGFAKSFWTPQWTKLVNAVYNTSLNTTQVQASITTTFLNLNSSSTFKGILNCSLSDWGLVSDWIYCNLTCTCGRI